MWTICYSVPHDAGLRFDLATSEAEMLTTVRDRYHAASCNLEYVKGPTGRKMTAEQVGLFLMLLSKKSPAASAPAPRHPQ